MPNYKRLYARGGTYFFTVALRNREASLLTDRIEDLRAAWRWTARRHPFRTDAYVVLPEHLHCIWTLPPEDRDFSTRWRLLKGRFARAIDPADDPAQGRRAGERGIWQRRFWEHLIRNDADWNAHVAYIHDNPVRHGYVMRREDWSWSSWRRFAAAATWAEDRPAVEGDFGEPCP
jgi:putative transposase